MSYTMSSLFFYNISEYLSVNKFFFYIFFSKMLYISTVAFQKNSCSRLWNYSINDTVNHICRNTAVQDENYTINTTQLYSGGWGGVMNVPSITCIHKAFFVFVFCSVYKITHSRQGATWAKTEGWMTSPFVTPYFKSFHSWAARRCAPHRPCRSVALTTNIVASSCQHRVNHCFVFVVFQIKFSPDDALCPSLWMNHVLWRQFVSRSTPTYGSWSSDLSSGRVVLDAFQLRCCRRFFLLFIITIFFLLRPSISGSYKFKKWENSMKVVTIW